MQKKQKRQHNNKSTDPKKYINAYTNSTTVNIHMKRKVYRQVDMVIGTQTQSNNTTDSEGNMHAYTVTTR